MELDVNNSSDTKVLDLADSASPKKAIVIVNESSPCPKMK
jgi:hypothetical protein